MCFQSPRHQRPTSLPNFLFGAPYYPEHWPLADRKEDASRMADAGMNVVRMAEFAWDLMEPARRKFNFSLFDQTIERLGKKGIQSILCTPTAAPPRWLTRSHGEWMRVDCRGQSMVHGSRQHCCTNHPGFIKESIRITRAMAQHFKDNPHVIGWQTDNEFFCHFSECYCPACLTAFHDWLKAKYRNIEELNQAWGTAFWAQTYDRFADIPFPQMKRPTHPNPGQCLDYYRFLSDGIGRYQSVLVQELRRANSKWWISHNGTFSHIDHWTFAKDLDFYGVDVYPGFGLQPGNHNEVDPVWSALKHEECRAASGNYVVFEQAGGAGGQRPYILPTPRPGQMRLWAWQAVAHGADGVLHFRWRTCRFGAEIYWNGILDHDNIPRRRYQEFSLEGKEFKRIGDKLLGTVPLIRAAILTQNDQDEAHTTMPLGLPSPKDQRKAVLRELQARHIPCGVVDASDSFDGLELIFLPGFVLMDEDLAARLHAFIDRGGVLAASARTATRDRHNRVSSLTAPVHLNNIFGITIEEWGAGDPLSFTLGRKIVSAESVYEILKPVAQSKSKTLARWNRLPSSAPHAAPGTVAATLNRVGKGHALYFGTFFGKSNTSALITVALSHTKINELAHAAAEVEISCRRDHKRQFLFLLNHSGKTQAVTKLKPGIDLITSQLITSRISIPSSGVAVIENIIKTKVPS